MTYDLPVFSKTDKINDPVIAIILPKEEPKPAPKLYTIVENDTLTSIAQSQNVPVERLWAANTELSNPDLIEPGRPLHVPETTDVLADRAMPVSIESSSFAAGQQTSPPSGGFSSSGNTYYYGQCVWYLKNILPWVQNGWGNANQWIYTSGHAVGATPVVGAVAAARGYNHVALVIGVSGNTVTVSEMNAQGVGVISTRTTPISEWSYIYP